MQEMMSYCYLQYARTFFFEARTGLAGSVAADAFVGVAADGAAGVGLSSAKSWQAA